MIKKVRFFMGEKYSDIHFYDTEDEDWQTVMDQEQVEWVFSQLETGWQNEKKDYICNNCVTELYEEDLRGYNESSKVDNTTLEYIQGCPNCKTNEYLIEL